MDIRFLKPRFIAFISVIVVFSSCEQNKITGQDLKEKFGDFGNKSILLKEVDITSTPIYKKIEHHPNDFGYLKQVDIFSIAHKSDGFMVSGFMVAPKKPGKYPCIVFNRGGNREAGSLVVATAVEIMAPFAEKGYVVIATNYRGNKGSEGMEEFGGKDVNDVINLIKSLSEVEKADTSRIALLGISRGAMMNYLVLKKGSVPAIKCVANIGGITDLETTIKFHPEIEDVCSELIPDFKQTRPDALTERSAVKWTDKLPQCPVLLLHSKDDNHVNYSQIPIFADSLEKHNKPYKLVSFENDNHGIVNHSSQVQTIISEWFDRYLNNKMISATEEKRIVVK